MRVEVLSKIAELEASSWDALVPPDDTTPWPPAGWRYLDLVVPAERFPYMAARELGALGGATGVAFAIAAVAVRRRRPG